MKSAANQEKIKEIDAKSAKSMKSNSNLGDVCDLAWIWVVNLGDFDDLVWIWVVNLGDFGDLAWIWVVNLADFSDLA